MPNFFLLSPHLPPFLSFSYFVLLVREGGVWNEGAKQVAEQASVQGVRNGERKRRREKRERKREREKEGGRGIWSMC